MSADRIAPDATALFAAIAAAGGPKIRDMAPDAVRGAFLEMVAAFDRAEDGPSSDLMIPAAGASIPARLYGTPAMTGPAVVYLHGGGWVAGDLETHDPFCHAFARALGLRIVAIDYRRAPEHPFPAAYEDALAACGWVASSPASLGAPVDGIAIAGDSAGGNLAAAVSPALHGPEAPRARLLLYPVTDCAAQSPSYVRFAEGHLLERADMAYFIESYLPDAADRADPRASPLRAGTLDGAPTMILTCALDPLRDEGRAYAARLIESGVTVDFVEAPGLPHGIATLRQALPSAGPILAATIARFGAMLTMA